MNGKLKAPIDPRTTRRRVPFAEYQRNTALYAQYRILGTEGIGYDLATPRDVVIQKKDEFCVRR